MQHIEHSHHPTHGLLRESDQYMPGHGLGAYTGHESQAGHTVDMFRIAFGFSLLLTIPVLIWDPLVQVLFGYQVRDFIGYNLTPALFATAVFYYGGQVFMRGAYRELRDHQPGMMVLITLAICVTFLYSAMVLFGFPGQTLWLQLALLITLLLFGNWIDIWSITRAERAIDELGRLLPTTTLRLMAEEQVEKVTLPHLRIGHLLLIQPGEIIPADGVVKYGASSVDESMLTGETQPVAKQEGDKVLAGTINLGEAALRIEVTATEDNTALAGVKRQLEEMLSSRSRTQTQTDRAAYFLTIIAVAAAGLTLLIWLVMGASLQFTITRMITVLVIACPPALGLAVPLVFAVAITRGVRQGLLVRDRRGLEDARTINIVAFDSGVLTMGELRVLETVTSGTLSPPEALHLAAAVERTSEHPLAQVIRAAVHEGELPPSSDIQTLSGLGVQANVEGRSLMVGGATLLQQHNIELPAELAQAAERFRKSGLIACYLCEAQQPLAVFAIADPVRHESYEAIANLHKLGIEVALFTPESDEVANVLARRLGIDKVFAQVPPEAKVDKICKMQDQGNRVAIVGAGHCDTALMMVADVSMAFGAGTRPSDQSGDIALVRTDPRDVARIINLSKAAYRKMVENVGWAVLYNLIAIPIGAGVLIGYGLLLSPVVGALVMAASTAVVALNAQRLHRTEL